MPTNMENPAVVTGLEKVSFHSNFHSPLPAFLPLTGILPSPSPGSCTSHWGHPSPGIWWIRYPIWLFVSVLKFGKLSSGHRTGKGQFSLQSQRKYAKECPYYHTIALTSHTSKLMLKILQARLQQYVNHELPDVQARFRKGRGARDQIANIHWIIEKARDFQ